jgi:hypothetical protein
MSSSWRDVQRLMDDPFVDADTKEHLLAAYLRERGYVSPLGGGYVDKDRLPDDVRHYYDQYKIRGGDYNQGSLDDVYDDARSESEEHGYSSRLAQQEIGRNTAALNGLGVPAEGQSSGGVE